MRVEHDQLPLQDIISGASSAAIVAYVRSHPAVNQIACITSTFCEDLPAKAMAAGITIGKDGIGLTFAAGADSGQISWFGNGTAVSGQATPYVYVGWQLVDAMARHSVHDSLTPNWNHPLPMYLYNQQNTRAGTKPYDGPTGFRQHFAALWSV